MATRSYIGILKENGKVEAVYCHYDGYYKGVGDKLVNFYNSKELAQKLVNLAGFSALEETLTATKKEAGKDFKKETFASIYDFIQCAKMESDTEYIYLFDTKLGEWLGLKCHSIQSQFLPIEEAKSFEVVENVNQDNLDAYFQLTPEEKEQGLRIEKVKDCFYNYYLRDKNNNRWDLRKIPFKMALFYANNLVDCYNCFNCRDCVNCVNCVNCKNCLNCLDCDYCQSCSDCIKCSLCENCADCVNCRHCQNCSKCAKCHTCKNCKSCALCQDCKDCEACSNCSDCINCQGCIKCLMCESSQGLIDSYKFFESVGKVEEKGA